MLNACFLQIKMHLHTRARDKDISCTSKFLYSSTFYHQNPKFNLIFILIFTYFYHFDQIFIIIFLIFTIFLVKIVLIRSQDFDSIFMFSAFFITPSHQKVTTIGIQSIFKKLITKNPYITPKFPLHHFFNHPF